MITDYGPGDTWPLHQNAHWNEALRAARRAGWTLRHLGASHRFGDAFCPGDEDGSRCTFRIDMTARDSEVHSREALKDIRLCPHGTATPGSKVKVRQQECQRLLDRADCLIEDADSALARAEARQVALAELERVQMQLEVAAENLAEILRDDEDEALQRVYDTDDAPTPDEISEIIDDARDAVASGEAVATLLRTSRPRLAKPFLDHAKEAHSRLNELRVRLTTLM